MKKVFLSILILCIFVKAYSTTYYFSTGGNDANDGTSSSTPWQTLTKFNSAFSSKSPGDNFLFNRGDVFYGKMIISRSGSPVTIGAYGTGPMPVITGFSSVTDWKNLGGNIWESTSAVSTLPTCNMMIKDGINYAMGRFPNSGYLTYQSATGTSSITSTSLKASVTNWTGAWAVIRMNNYVTLRCPVTAHSGSTLKYAPSNSGLNAEPGFGFYIQNHPGTLDVQNEWYYNPSTKKIRIYAESLPTNVKVSTIDTLVTIIGSNSFVTFDGLTFTGSNKNAFTVRSAQNITIQNCKLDFNGQDGIWGGQNGGVASTTFIIRNNTFDHTNNSAITLENEFRGYLITHNTILNSGMNDGMGGTGAGNYGTLFGIQCYAADGIIEYNTIIGAGYDGIKFDGNNVTVRKNYVSNACYQKIDGGGIYTQHSFSGQKILNNVVVNCTGSGAGTIQTGNPIVHGIYLDDGSANVEVAGNTASGNSYSGLYLHSAYNCNVHDNIFFNNGIYQALITSYSLARPMRVMIIKKNAFISKTAKQKTVSFQTRANDISSFGNIDSNYYARPVDDHLTIETVINNYKTFTNRTLEGWQLYSGFDIHSKKAPIKISDPNKLLIVINNALSDSLVRLDANYKDLDFNDHLGKIILQPFSSAILIFDSRHVNISPSADAGPDQTITLPSSTVTLSGSGSDADGSVTSYRWTQISGPDTAIFGDSTNARTVVNSLDTGTYIFQLTVKDDRGDSASDVIKVVVNPEVIFPPSLPQH